MALDRRRSGDDPPALRSVLRRSQARSDGSTDERLCFISIRAANSRHAQGTREASLAAGDFAICSANEPYSLDLLKRHELLVVEFPRAPLAERVPDLEDRLVRAVSGQSSGARIFHDFLLSLWRQGDQSAADPAWQSGVSGVFYDLVALAMRGGEAKPRPRRTRRASACWR